MYAVVIDANAVVEGDWLLRAAPWTVLAHERSNYRCDLVVPEVVVREIVAAYRRAVGKAAQEHTKAVGALRRLGITAVGPAVDPDAETARYEVAFRARLRQVGAVIENPPVVDLLAMTDRALMRRPPFDAKGSGFRDAIVWAHVLHAGAMGPVTRVVLVSNDGDFRDGASDGLHPALATEASDAGAPPVALARSVTDLMDALGLERPDVTASVVNLVAAEQDQIAENIRLGVLATDIFAEPRDVDVSIYDAGLPYGVNVAIVRVHDDPAEPIAYVELETEIDLELQIDAWYERHQTGLRQGTFSVTASATYDIESGELRDVTVPSLDVDANEWLEEMFLTSD